jgi:hypothetical protein
MDRINAYVEHGKYHRAWQVPSSMASTIEQGKYLQELLGHARSQVDVAKF